MLDAYRKLRTFFPGKKFTLLILNLLGLFAVSLLEMVGVTAVLPIINLASGVPIEGYLRAAAEFFGNPDRSTLIIIFGIILVLSFVVKGIFSLIMKRWSMNFVARQQSATSVNLLNRYMRETYLEHRKRNTMTIVNTVDNVVNQAYAAFVNGIINFVGESLSVLMLMLMLLIIMPVPALFAFVYFTLATFLLQYLLRRKNREQGAVVLESTQGSLNAIAEAVLGYREVRMHGMADRYMNEYKNKRTGAVNAYTISLFLQDVPKYILEIIFILGIAGLSVVVTISEQGNSAPYLLLFCSACIRILPSYTRVVASLGNIRSGEKASNILMEEISALKAQNRSLIMPEFSDAPEHDTIINTAIEPVSIHVDNLTFSYPDSNKPVLKNINIQIPMGTSVAFVGGSGSGKTTLVDIILGFISPAKGRVLCNGEPIQDNISAWFHRIGYVPQDVFLADSTIMEAVAFGLRGEEIDIERVKYCLDMAEMTGVVDSLPDGLNTTIGDKGTRLSGGQRQRLGIARALYTNPSVLIMDEATSALDNETEYKITKTIERISRNITVIIVAHRLSTVRNADQIIYLSRGEILARGTFVEVQEQNQEFAHLVQLGQLPE